MTGFLLYFAFMSLSFLALSKLLPGFQVDGWGSALAAALVLGFLNAVVKPVLTLLTLPLTLLTLGLFLLVLNALMLWLTSSLVPGLSIPGGFGTTFLASILLSVMGMIWKSATKKS
jgi:putative membrane protein